MMSNESLSEFFAAALPPASAVRLCLTGELLLFLPRLCRPMTEGIDYRADEINRRTAAA